MPARRERRFPPIYLTQIGWIQEGCSHASRCAALLDGRTGCRRVCSFRVHAFGLRVGGAARSRLLDHLCLTVARAVLHYSRALRRVLVTGR